MANDVFLLENVMPSNWIDDVKSIVKSNGAIQYRYASETSYGEPDQRSFTNEIDSIQFEDLIVLDDNRSHDFWMIYPLVLEIENRMKENGIHLNRLVRAKINLLPATKDFPEDHYNKVHADWIDGVEDYDEMPENYPLYYSAIYYLDADQNPEANGHTFVFNEKQFGYTKPIDKGLTIRNKVFPTNNNATVLQSNRLHASSPSRTRERFVINMVWEAEDVR